MADRRRELRWRAGAGAAGRQRVRSADRPELHPAAAAHAGRREPGAQRRQGAPGRGDRGRPSRRSRTCRPTSAARARALGRAQPGVAEHRAGRPQANASARRRRWKTRSARRSPRSPASTSRSASTVRSTWPSSAATPTAWPGCRRSSPRRSRRSRARSTSNCRSSPACPPIAVRLKPGAVRELGLTAPQLAASLRAYVNGEAATYWTTPDGDQVEVLLRLPRVAARTRRADAQPARGLRQGRHADHAGQRGEHRTGVQPGRHPPPEPAAARGDLRRRARTAARRRRGRRCAEARQGDHAAAGLQLRCRRPDAASRQEAFSAHCSARWRWR